MYFMCWVLRLWHNWTRLVFNRGQFKMRFRDWQCGIPPIHVCTENNTSFYWGSATHTWNNCRLRPCFTAQCRPMDVFQLKSWQSPKIEARSVTWRTCALPLSYAYQYWKFCHFVDNLRFTWLATNFDALNSQHNTLKLWPPPVGPNINHEVEIIYSLSKHIIMTRQSNKASRWKPLVQQMLLWLTGSELSIP